MSKSHKPQRRTILKPITLVIPYHPGSLFEKTLLSLMKSDLIQQVIVVSQESVDLRISEAKLLMAPPIPSGELLRKILGEIHTPFLLLIPDFKPISIEPDHLEQFVMAAESGQAGLIYSDFYEQLGHSKTFHPLIDYQPGSVRDDFDFGTIMFFSISAIQQALKKYGLVPEVKFAGLYDLRLKVSIDHPIYHLPKPLYCRMEVEEISGEKRLFAYLDPHQQPLQKEMESVFTDYLKRIGAYLPPRYKKVEMPPEEFPVEASVIIPVRNRKTTIGEAIENALSQRTDFPFNILIIDNHSTDGTTEIVSDFTRKNPHVHHLIPNRTGLGIGGCWNEAIHHQRCGRYAIQLDSDDLYSSPYTLQRMVNELQQERLAMVIGSYTLIDSNFKVIPPGLIDHREWTDENGHNNALRINGLGAPRGFHTSLLRTIGFPNVSYGEDYAVALRICREYKIGRIYENLYLCRRWSGNTDANLSVEEENQKNAFKDKIRTDEILARQEWIRPD